MQSCKIDESENRPNIALKSIIIYIKTKFFLYILILCYIYFYLLMLLRLVPNSSIVLSNSRLFESVLYEKYVQLLKSQNLKIKILQIERSAAR